MNIDKEKYSQMIKNIKIQTVLLKKSSVNDTILPKKETKMDVKFSYECKEFNAQDDIFEAFPHFSVELLDDERVYSKIDFELRIIYKIQNLGEYSEEFIKIFIEKNIPVNIWPYAREYISSTTGRLGFPQLVIPPFTVK